MAVDINAATFVNHACWTRGLVRFRCMLPSSAGTNFTNDGTLSTMDPDASIGGTIDIGAFVQGSGTIEINGGGGVTLGSAISTSRTIDFLGAGAQRGLTRIRARTRDSTLTT